MLLLPNKKKAITLIIGSMGRNEAHKTDNGVHMPDEEKTDYSMAAEDAGRKVMDALSENNLPKFISYMKELVYILKDDDNDMGMMG